MIKNINVHLHNHKFMETNEVVIERYWSDLAFAVQNRDLKAIFRYAFALRNRIGKTVIKA